MPQIKLGANRAYPSLPTVSGDVENHTVVLNAIREAMEIHERRTRKVFDSFVRVQELVDLGIVNIDGETGIVLAPNDDTDGSDTHNHDSLYIRLDGASPPTTGSVEFGAPVSMTGTLSVDGTVTIDDDLGVTGAITAASYGGINEDNLVDKAAVEAITGNWTFSGTLVIPEAAVTDHEAALSITESQISDFDAYLPLTGGLMQGAIDMNSWGIINADDVSTEVVFLAEKASPYTDKAGFGQLWVKNDTEQSLWFTWENGTDLEIATYIMQSNLDSNSFNITVQGGGALRFEEDSVSPVSPVAGYGVVWVKNDTPNTIWFTDDAGTDHQLGVGGGGMSDLIDDTTPQLGGDLDTNSHGITGLTTLTLESTGDVSLFLKADTDNSGEDDNPFIRFEQDGNLVNGVIGLTGDSSVDAQGNTFTNAGSNGISIHSFTNSGTNGNIALGCEGAAQLLIDTAGIDVKGDILINTYGSLAENTATYGGVMTAVAKGSYYGFSCNGVHTWMSNGTTYGLFDDANNKWAINAVTNSYTQMYHNGSIAIRTQNQSASGVSTSGFVYHRIGTAHDIGLNVMPSVPATSPETIDGQHVGGVMYYNSAGTVTVTVNGAADVPTGAVVTIFNIHTTGTITVAASGVTLYWFQGGSRSTGNRTVAPGSVVTLYKYSSGAWFISGNGIS